MALFYRWRNRGGKCYDDLCFLDDLRSCMDKVRFLLLTEHDFKYHVLPSEVIPFEDVEVMLRMIRGEQQRRHGLAYYVHDPVLQGTRRPRLLKIVKLGVQVADRTIPEPGLLYKKNTDDRSIAWFTVDKLCHIRAISSTSILDDSGGTLTVTNNHGFLASQKWVHYSSTFEQPLTLQPNIPYDFVHTSKTGVSDEECSVPMKKTVGGVTFEGLLYCTSLTLEFATTLSESESDSKSESSSSESENDTGTSSSDGAGSIEVIQEAEVRIAELHLSAAEQGKSQNGEALGQESRRPNGGGASTQAAADRKSANNEVHQQPMLRVSQQKMFRELMDEALKDD